LTPDSQLVTRIAPSPNFEARLGNMRPNMLMLHYTGMTCAEKAIMWLSAPESKVSCHYVIDEAGVITQLVPETMRAWHAGVANWANDVDINSHSIGIEVHNGGHDHGYPDFPEPQMAAVEALCRDILARYRIEPARVLAHSDVAPRRKRDPGEKFDWARLARAGIGHWVEPAPPGGDDGLGCSDTGNAVMRLHRQLRAYGYWIEAHGFYDEHTEIIVTAFQRHFRPALVNGRADASTIETLDRLIASRTRVY